MNTKPGFTCLTAAIASGQKSSGGGGTSISQLHVRLKVSFIISIAISQRTPSLCTAISRSVAMAA
jgi:hypothetical protein